MCKVIDSFSRYLRAIIFAIDEPSTMKIDRGEIELRVEFLSFDYIGITRKSRNSLL